MLIAAAVCPHPPLLIPEATGAPGAADPELNRLRAACRNAVAALLAEPSDLIVVAGGAERTAEFPPRHPVAPALPPLSAAPLPVRPGRAPECRAGGEAGPLAPRSR